jgi:Cu/Ag efflux protein CusF
MRTVVRLMMAVGLILVLFGCKGASREGQEERTHGTVKAIDPQARTLVLSEKWQSANTNEVVKARTTYKIAFDCKIRTADKRKATLDDLKVGDRINITFVREPGLAVIRKITPRGLSATQDVSSATSGS